MTDVKRKIERAGRKTQKCSLEESITIYFRVVYTKCVFWEWEIVNFFGLLGGSKHSDEWKIVEDENGESTYPVWEGVSLFRRLTKCGKVSKHLWSYHISNQNTRVWEGRSDEFSRPSCSHGVHHLHLHNTKLHLNSSNPEDRLSSVEAIRSSNPTLAA